MTRERVPTRADYRVFYPIPTRWLDNDLYGHINNVYYYAYFDTAIAHLLMGEGGFTPWADPVIGYCIQSGCRFHKAARFPDRITAGLRIGHIGRSSVRYEIGLFVNDDDAAAASGFFVHVFVDRETERPAKVPERIRAALDAFHIPPA